ncbi:uncharacterized protein LOC129573823 [Sitodiplosis mosellana]|uniref:uncharacterized protein LOC129573823 n=1 Tax=Sitodiplosis mosellana TaxID=263140 RepID=UPI0024452E48|nr:uncharacterized protein LOC129573823 [Sitodiplosis mosellana]
MVEPLNMNRKASKAELSRMVIDSESSSDMEYNGNESFDRGLFKKSRQPVTINIAPSKTGTQTVNIILNDGSVSKKPAENLVIESKIDRGHSQIVDQLTAVERHPTSIEQTESRSSQGDRAQKRNHGTDKDRSPETSKRKKSENESEREHRRG